MAKKEEKVATGKSNKARRPTSEADRLDATPATASGSMDVLHDALKKRRQARERSADDKAARAAEKTDAVAVSAGPVDKIVDMVFNPSQEKMLEFTVLDRNQTRLIPQLGVLDDVWEYCIEIASFRYDSEWYKQQYNRPRPVLDNTMKRYIFLTAQCQKSLQGQNLKSAIDLALADVETRAERDTEEPFARLEGE